MTGMVRDLTPDAKRMKAAAGAGYATATDLADWLVRTLKMPFREAHHVTGRIVALAVERGVALEKLPLAEMQSVEPRITPRCSRCWRRASVKSRTSYGGTAPAMCASRRGVVEAAWERVAASPAPPPARRPRAWRPAPPVCA